MGEFEFGGGIVWRPTEEYIEKSRLKEFMDIHGIKTWDELWEKSVKETEWFWKAVLDFLKIEFYEPYEKIVDFSKGYPWTRWCVGGKMNIVHNCLDKWIGTPRENKVALIWEGEEGTVRKLTYRELWREVNRVANGLKKLGLGKGDAIGLYMPMIPEIAVALLAIVKIGGIVLPLFSGYGAKAISTRLADADAKALFTVDGAYRRGKIVPMKPTADEALKNVPTIEKVIVYRRTNIEVNMKDGRDIFWEDFLKDTSEEFETEKTDAEDVLMIIYTSGTTGKPKGAVHIHCGFPIKAAQDMAHGLDLHEDDILYWLTDMGWMMGPWEVFGTLLLGSTFVLYDGAPDYPDVDRLWSLVEKHRITALGVSPTLIRSLMKHGDGPVKKHDLSSLRLAGSTGEPWNPEPWMWFFKTVLEGRKPIINYSGGTEVSGGILMGNVMKPLKPAAFSGPLPGMYADVVDENGNSVRNQVGELVVRKPWLGMTYGFWKDPDRYIRTYWSRFKDVWVHGDWAAVDEDGLWYILGRSDDVIKVAGKRLGPAEVESIVVEHPAVVEAAAVGVPDPVKGQVVVVFAVLKEGAEDREKIKEEIKDLIVKEMGKALAPKDVHFVSQLPQTRNAKVIRRAIRAAYIGEDPGDLSSLLNPEALEEIKELGRKYYR